MKKIQVLIKPQCDAEIRNQFVTKFELNEFTFQGKETEDAIVAAEVMIGEPGESELQKAENLRWLQLTWAGVDKYTKMKAFPTGVTLTNASGAFGKIISEYVIGNIIALYRGLRTTGRTNRNISGHRINHQKPYMEKISLFWEPGI